MPGPGPDREPVRGSLPPALGVAAAAAAAAGAAVLVRRLLQRGNTRVLRVTPRSPA